MTTVSLRTPRLLLGAGLAILLSACSATSAPAAPNAATSPAGGAPASSAPAAAGGRDACQLLTKAEVEAAFGETMMAPVPATERGDQMCTFTHETGGLDLTISISSTPSTASAIKAGEAAYAGAGADVPGVGDAAFEVASILEFVKGTTLVTIGTGDGPGIISDAKFRALCAEAAGRV